MESNNIKKTRSRTEYMIAILLCSFLLVVWILMSAVPHKSVHAHNLAPFWLPVAATVFALSGIIQTGNLPQWLHNQRAFLWIGLLLMFWLASGLLFDILTLAGLIGDPTTGQRISVNWSAMTIRTLAFLTAIILARIALAYPVINTSTRPATWYSYAAFILALPYPVLRIYWSLGGTTGLLYPGAAGHGFVPLLLTIPWFLAALLSLLLASPRQWKPRKLMLTAGWTATAIVATIGPAACWSLITKLANGDSLNQGGISIWVFGLLYGSWFLWSIAAGAATRSYQLRSQVLKE